MKIIHIISGLTQGGAESQLERLILSSNPKKNEHIVITLRTEDTAIKKRLLSNGIVVYELGFNGLGLIPGFFNLRALLKQLYTIDSIIQCWMYIGNFFGLLTAITLKLPHKVVWNIRRTEIPKGVSGLLSKICGVLSYRYPVPIICCAYSAKESHIKAGYNSENMTVIHNGIDTDLFTSDIKQRNSLRKKFDIKSDELVLGMVGRFAEVKGHIYLLQALKIISLNSPLLFNKLKIILIGRNIFSAPTLSTLLNDENLKKRILVVDETSHVQDYMQGFDIYCMPSESEGFPNVVAEAMACSVPAIVTDVGDAAFIVNNSNFVVPPFQPAALAQVIQQTLQLSAIEKETLSKSSRRRICQNFSISLALSKYNDLYQKLIG